MTRTANDIVPGDLRTAAIRRLHKKREFYEHLISYLIVNGMLVAVWLVLGLTTDAWFPWPLFPIAGWGFLGLAISPKLIVGAFVPHLLFGLFLWGLCRLAFKDREPVGSRA